MIVSSNIKLYVDDVLTPLHDPEFGVAHTSDASATFDDVVNNGTLNCITLTDVDNGSTKVAISAATTLRLVVTTAQGDVSINVSLFQMQEAYGGTHYSAILPVS